MSGAVIDRVKRVYHHFDTPPAAISLVNYRFYMVLNLAQTMAWITHSAWLWLFLILKVYPMAYMQLLGVLLYAISILLNRRAYHMLSMSISMFEIVFHQIVATRLLGWDAGFQYFIPVASIFPFLIPKANLVWKWTLVLAASLGYLYIDFFIRKTVPLYHIHPVILNSFNVINILLAFGFFTMWAWYFTISVNRSQIIIDEQTRSLARIEHEAAQAMIQQKLEMKEHENAIISQEKKRYEDLLLNILPYEVAQELMEFGKSEARLYQNVSVMFTDFKGFTRISEALSPAELVAEIDICFKAFDNIIGKYNIEKIKTIGDSYMAVSGLPIANERHAHDVVMAAMEIQQFMNMHNDKLKASGKAIFETRVGIHSGAVVAGIVGLKKFAYDIWGDTVNVASRMESNCEEGKVNVSGATYELIKNDFKCRYRGKIDAKNKGEIDMYFMEEKA